MNEPKVFPYDLKKHVVDIIITGKGGHIGGDMSVMEIPVELYMKQTNISPEDKELDNRDRFVLSKDHSAEDYYAILAKKGLFPTEGVISTFSQLDSKFIGHPNNKLPRIKMNPGSLGYGLPVCAGTTMAGKMDRKGYRVYVVMGDGELAGGSVQEGAMTVSHYRLDNLCAMVDRSRLQISRCTEDVMGHDSLHERFRSFGWHVTNVTGGNDINQLDAAFEEAKTVKGEPTVLIANTVKGCGSPAMRNKVAWHHKVPTTQGYSEIVWDSKKKKEALLRE